MLSPIHEHLKEGCRFKTHGNCLIFEQSTNVSDAWENQQNQSISRYQDTTYEADGTLGELFGGFIAVSINREGLALDIGCGLHQKLPHYVRNLGLSQFLGIEPLPVIIDREFHCLTGVSAESIPLKDNVADSAIFATSLDHIEHADVAIKEVLRTLKKAGRCYFWLGVHDPFILAEAKTYGVVHNHSTGFRKWVRIIFSPIEHLIFYFLMKKRASDLANGTPLDAAHVRYHTVVGVDDELAGYGLKINRRVLVPGSASLFVEAIRIE